MEHLNKYTCCDTGLVTDNMLLIWLILEGVSSNYLFFHLTKYSF